MFLAQYESEDGCSFVAFGHTDGQARQVLRDGVIEHVKHAAEFGRKVNLPTIEDVNVMEVLPGCCYRDYEVVFVNDKLRKKLG